MKELFAERFKSARLMNGYSLQDLSEKLGNISKQAIHKYEKGEVLPDSVMLDQLCEVLHVRPDYFTRETIVELGEISFRKLEKFSKREQNSITERTREFLSRYLEIEEILGIKKQFEHPVTEIQKIEKPEDVDRFAEIIREKWELGNDPIANVSELLEDKNIKVIELSTEDGFDGLQTWVNGKETPVIVLNRAKLISNDRKRFTALHELGHLLLPLVGLNEKMAEKYCHRFAGAMLFPEKAAKTELGENRSKISIQELGFIKEQYGISIQALVYRLWDLGIISEYYKNYFYKYISQMGWRVHEPFEYKGKEESSRFDQLIYRSLAEEIISMSKAASLNNMKLAEFRKKSLIIE